MNVRHVKKTNDMITKAVEITMSLTIAAMAVLIITSVFVRNVMGFSFQWIVDVNRLIFIWMCFLGIIYVSDKDQLIRFEILDNHFSPAIHKYVTVVRYTASIVLFGVMLRAGILVSEFAKAQVFSTIPVSTMWLYIPVIVAGFILILQTIVKLLLLFKPLDTSDDVENLGIY